MARRKETNWKKGRRLNFRMPSESHYIFCEGQSTEPNYFKSFQRIIQKDPVYKNRIYVQIVRCAKGNLTLLQEAVNYVKTNGITRGHVWCVFDKDDFPVDDFNNSILKVDQLNKSSSEIRYHSIWSNESFELWFLLHFERLGTSISRSSYITKLEKYLGKQYKKNSTEMFDLLLSKGSPSFAIKNSISLLKDYGGDVMPSEKNPATMVHELVITLSKYFDDAMKESFLGK